MSVDFVLHVAVTEQEEYHMRNYCKATTWSSRTPFDESGCDDEYLENWHRSYNEVKIDGNWYAFDEILNMPEEEYDKMLDRIEDRREIFVYVNEDIVFHTPHMFIVDSKDMSKDDELDASFRILDDDMIDQILSVSKRKEPLDFLQKHKGKYCHIIAW